MVVDVPKPFVDLVIAGVSAELTFGDTLKEFRYRDVHHGEADEITFTLVDRHGKWRGSWGFDEGTEISGTMGYAGPRELRVPCGRYAVGETEIRGDSGGDLVVVHAQAAFTSKELRTERSDAYEKMSLAAVISRGADRHGLTVQGDIPDLSFERLSQDKQSDLAFWTRLAEDWGCYFSIKGDTLVFTDRKTLEEARPVRTFDLQNGAPVLNYRLSKSTHKLYPKAEARYLNPKTKKMVTATAQDPRVSSGDTLKIEEPAETGAHAERLCQARLARANDNLGTGKITMVGDPLMLAGQVIELGNTFGRYAGRWLVVTANHQLSASGYTTSIDIKLI